MSGVKVIRALLVAASPVTAVVPAARIQAPLLDQGQTDRPAIVLQQVSRVADPAAGAATQARYSRTRVQVTVLAQDYPQLVALCDLVDAAVTYRSGVIAGVTVTLIERELVGPDLIDDELTPPVPYRHIDFLVWHQD